MDTSGLLATFNAACNATAAVLLILGVRAIRRKDVTAHRRFMLSAFAVSSIFLVAYVTRMALFGSRSFGGEGAVRTVYLVVLASHSILATLMLPFVLRTLYLPLRRRFDSHRRIARFTFPVWTYVSVTGVVVYLMLYHL